MSITETKMQAILMRHAMADCNHIYVLPNSTIIYPWESDLISVTKALFAHEYEIKISLADYKKDKEKKWKHYSLRLGDSRNTPNYFWYATFEFDIEPPEHAGWLKIEYNAKQFRYFVHMMKEAPRLHTKKLTDDQQFHIAKLLSWRLSNYYNRYLFSPQAENFEQIITQGIETYDPLS